MFAKPLFGAAILALGGIVPVLAEDFEVQMFNHADGATMVFEPAYLHI